MKYIALLRGINVGGNHKVDMKSLKALFESSGCTGVSTYINSGNVFFESGDSSENLRVKIETGFEAEFGYYIPVLIKTKKEIIRIAGEIPAEWQNDHDQKTDVAYLFSDADSEEIISSLPVKREYIDIKYVKGALIWNVKRVNVNKSRLSSIVSHKLYQSMTVRNVNTARYLAEH